MYKITLILAMLMALCVNGQTKTNSGPKKKQGGQSNKQALARRDSLRKDSLKPTEVEVVHREFTVYTKKSRSKSERTKLCINLVWQDVILNYCMNDSLCKEPEVSQVLFQERQGDTLYVLVYIDAFTKVDPGTDDARCNAGKETKLVFARWDTKTNKAKWKQKNVSSCTRGITNMSKQPILDWDKTSPLLVSYHRGLNFYDLKFDPAEFRLGLQSTNNTDSESK